MQRQLQEIVDEFSRASESLARLRSVLDDDQWRMRRDPDRWSPLECIAHLNLTSEAFVPRIESALADAPSADKSARFRRDPLGWLLWKTLPPPVRLKTRTSAPFIPAGDADPDTVMNTFAALQETQIELVRRCEGLRIDRVKIVSPFDARVKYNLFSALSILPRHQHRHIWQAAQAACLPTGSY